MRAASSTVSSGVHFMKPLVFFVAKTTWWMGLSLTTSLSCCCADPMALLNFLRAAEFLKFFSSKGFAGSAG